MKKCCVLVALALLLTGCGVQETFETVADVYVQPVSVKVGDVSIMLPEDASVAVLENPDAGTLYLCDGYTLTLQTLQAGDLDRTLRQVTGFSRENLTLMQTTDTSCKRYECVWSAAGEAEDQVGRATVLDDGNYHYVLTVMAGASKAGELNDAWREIFDSFCLH